MTIKKLKQEIDFILSLIGITEFQIPSLGPVKYKKDGKYFYKTRSDFVNEYPNLKEDLEKLFQLIG